MRDDRSQTTAQRRRGLACLIGASQDRIELKRGDFIEVEVSQYPIPTVSKSSATCLRLAAVPVPFLLHQTSLYQP